MARQKQVNWAAQPFDQLSDRQLARRLGVSPRIVAIARSHYERVVEERATATSPGECYVAALNICRDDRCDREDVHPKHAIADATPDPFYDAGYFYNHVERHGETLRAITLKHIPHRRCKPFRELLDDIRHDYGESKWLDRAVYRALTRLQNDGTVVAVPLPKGGCRASGGYVRGDSPLLQSEDGVEFLQETLEDARPTTW